MLVHGGECHRQHSNQMDLRRPLGDPACSWEENVGGSQCLEAVKAREACAVIGMLRDGETDSGGAIDVELYQE